MSPMNRPKLPLATLVILYGALVALVIVTNPRLPHRMASHFGIDGTPDGWMPRSAYSVFALGMAALTAILCAGSFYLPRLLPDSAVNVPHRGYWLAPERRGEFNDRMAALGLWIACLTVALFLGLHLLVARANQAVPVRLPAREGLGLVAAFLAALGGFIGTFCDPDDTDR